MEAVKSIPVLSKTKTTQSPEAVSSCCTPKNNESICCTPNDKVKENGGPCCDQPGDGSPCCNK